MASASPSMPSWRLAASTAFVGAAMGQAAWLLRREVLQHRRRLRESEPIDSADEAEVSLRSATASFPPEMAVPLLEEVAQTPVEVPDGQGNVGEVHADVEILPAVVEPATQQLDPTVESEKNDVSRERPMGLRTLLAALQASDRVSPESISGPFQMSAGDEVPVVCFQFRMSHFTCKAYLAHGTQDEGGSQHLKLQTIFEDNRRSLGEEQRYFVANEWNATKRYTRLKCGSGGTGRSSVFTLEYDVLCPAEMPHSWGLLLLAQTLRMWYTSMVACVMHIVEPRDMPFATHEMIMNNTLSVAVRPEDTGLLCEACPICFETFQLGETVRRLPCMHAFHVVGSEAESDQGRHCNIDRHLIRDKQCPVCKTPIDFTERVDRGSAKSSGDALQLAGAEGAEASVVLEENNNSNLPSQGQLLPTTSSTAAASVSGVATVTDTQPAASMVVAVAAAAQAAQAALVAAAQAAAVATADATAGEATAVSHVAGSIDGSNTIGLVVDDRADGSELVIDDNADDDLALAAFSTATAPSHLVLDVQSDALSVANTHVIDAQLQTDAQRVAEVAGQLNQIVAAGGPTAPGANGTGLPAQAAELERAVRSLQSRWLQIQDVVSGMQQMLQYIEESQSALSAARADANRANGTAPENENPATIEAGGQTENVVGEVMNTEEVYPPQASLPAPQPSLPALQHILPAAQPSLPAPQHLLPAPQPEDALRPASAVVEEVVPEVVGEIVSIPIPTIAASTIAAATNARTTSAQTVAPAHTPQPVGTDASSSAPDPLPGISSPLGLGAVPTRSDRHQVDHSGASASRWQPFTEVEKVCMAYAWRQRRAVIR